ncbi:RNA-binding protein 45 isoform X2 [Sitophilus oryzae]|uniref:RNA-binding protein 45 isoform X2 n=1 Tax=Sitophilus oryzae TaxID=7048 RepID=A0A6J2XTP4_SITOR|nr:RNA-binding protein 45 isoform X2 [Sitophilus oryzae]
MDNRKASSQGLENPPLSRLFIIGPKSLTEEDFRKHFEEYGTIEELWMVKDKGTGDYKGITYIKFSKTSEAAQALEMMNGASLANSSRRIKVMIASSREQGSKRDLNEEEKAQRLFIMCAKSVNEDDLHDYFRQFGELEYVSIIRDKGSGESKGIAYVKFFKFSSAAKAYEECDRKYKPVFAEPRRTEPSFRKAEPRDFPRGNFSNDYSGNTGTVRNLVSSSLAASSSGISEGYTKLTVIASPELNQDQLWKLFDIVPGMDYCQIRYEGGSSRPSRAVGEVVYTSSQWAAHAKEKLHGFEYPPGYRLIVKPDFEGRPDVPESSRKDLLSIAETLAQATSIIEAARLNPASLLNLGNGGHQPNCSVELPDPKPLVHIDEETVARDPDIRQKNI